MKRPLALAGLLLVPLVVVARSLAVIEMSSPPYDSVSLSPEPPAGFVFHSLISDPQPGPISEGQGMGVTLGSPTNGQVVFGASVRSYPTAWQERVMTFGSAKPWRSM